jgi:hypothetical protein
VLAGYSWERKSGELEQALAAAAASAQRESDARVSASPTPRPRKRAGGRGPPSRASVRHSLIYSMVPVLQRDRLPADPAVHVEDHPASGACSR